MILGFKRRFEPMVLDRSKRHTIRATRKRPFRVGDRCDCFVDTRQKTMSLLGRWPCTKVEVVRIEEVGRTIRVFIDGIELDRDECNALAWADGFRSRGVREAFGEMVDFWIAEHAKRKPLRFSGQIIHWNPEQNMPAPAKAKRRSAVA
jgi:hypothetical protein